MEAIKDIVSDLISGLKSKKSSGDNPEALLKKVFSTRELKHMQFKYFRKGVLGLNVDSSTRLYYLNLQKQNLLNRLTKEFRSIKDIHFCIGERE